MIYFIEDVLKFALIGFICFGLIKLAAFSETVILATRAVPL
jgi:hypothetical protein